MTDFENEQDYFVDQTAKMDIFAAAGAGAYACYRMFVPKVLALLPEHRELPFSQWFTIADRAARGEAAAEELAAARKSVEEYRQRELGLESIGPQQTSRMDALSVLFMFSLEDWPSKPETRARTSIVREIDEFSLLFIEFFGLGRELVQLLKESFGID